MRPLRPMEAVAGFSILASVLAVAVPTFIENVHASRLSEPIDGLKHLGAAASDFANGRTVEQAYPADTPLTPSTVPRGEAVLDPEGTWQHPTWVALGFAFEQPHYFSFSFESRNGAESSTFVARAQGDLDGDGILSSFELAGAATVGNEPVVYPLDIHREVE